MTLTEISPRLGRGGIEAAARTETPAADLRTPLPAHRTSLKPEASRGGFVSVPAHTGYTGTPRADLSRLSPPTAFPAKRERQRERERWGLTRFTHVYEMKFILGRAHVSADRKEPHSLPSPPLCLPPCTLPPFPENQ